VYHQELAQAKTKAGELAVAMKAKYGAAEAATGEDKIRLANDGENLALKLTEANVEVTRLSEKQTKYDTDMQLASDYLDVAPGNSIRRYGAEASDKKAYDERAKSVHAEAVAAFLREAGDPSAARDICKKHGMPEIYNTQVASDLTKGGILIQPEWGQLREGRQMPAVMRSLCDVQQTSGDSLTVPLIEGALEADNMKAEGFEHTTRQDVDMGGVTIKVNDWHPKPVVVSQKLLRNQGANIVQIISTRIMRRKDLDEDQQFLTGDGVGEAFGLMNEPGLKVVNSGSATTITWAGLLNLVYDDINGIGEEWATGATNLMRRATWAAVLNTPDPAGNYVFAVAAQAAPNTFLGEPTRFSPHMPSIAGDAFVIVRGWFPAYTIVDGPGGLSLKRLEEKFDPNVGFSVLGLFGGRCVEPEAFVKLKIAV